jgi:hypothetical protein
MMDGETYDFGLEPGESFIPEDIDDIDAAAPHIMTVLGPIAPGTLGPTNAATILGALVDPDRPAVNDALLTEIEEAGFAGIGAFVAIDADIAPIRWLAERSNLHLVAGISVPRLETFDAELAAVLAAASGGVENSGVLPGFIQAEFDQLAAALAASDASGLPVMVALEDAAIAQLIAMAPDGLERVIARVSRPVDSQRLLELVVTGAAVLFDGIAGEAEQDQRLAKTVAHLAQAGFLGSILLGYRPQSVPESVSYGVGSRWSYLIEQFPILVLEAGLDAMAMRAIMIDNPNDRFTIYPPEG